jgi:hypothetical protein
MNCECKICGKKFYRRKSLILKRIFCSIKCRDEDTYSKRIENIELTEREYILKNYEVLKSGELINRISGRIVKFTLTKDGYRKTRIYSTLSKHKDGRKPYYLHRIMALVYLDNYSDSLEVNHKDGNKLNNDISNLEMVTHNENMSHYYLVLKTKEDS